MQIDPTSKCLVDNAIINDLTVLAAPLETLLAGIAADFKTLWSEFTAPNGWVMQAVNWVADEARHEAAVLLPAYNSLDNMLGQGLDQVCHKSAQALMQVASESGVSAAALSIMPVNSMQEFCSASNGEAIAAALSSPEVALMAIFTEVHTTTAEPLSAFTQPTLHPPLAAARHATGWPRAVCRRSAH